MRTGWAAPSVWLKDDPSPIHAQTLPPTSGEKGVKHPLAASRRARSQVALTSRPTCSRLSVESVLLRSDLPPPSAARRRWPRRSQVRRERQRRVRKLPPGRASHPGYCHWSRVLARPSDTPAGFGVRASRCCCAMGPATPHRPVASKEMGPPGSRSACGVARPKRTGDLGTPACRIIRLLSERVAQGTAEDAHRLRLSAFHREGASMVTSWTPLSM